MPDQCIFNFRDTRQLVKINQLVYKTNVNQRDGMYVRVSKVGRSLIHLDSRHAFFIKDGHERSDYAHNTLWTSKKAYAESVVKTEILRKIRERLTRSDHTIKLDRHKLMDFLIAIGGSDNE